MRRATTDPSGDQVTVSVVIPHYGRPEPTLALATSIAEGADGHLHEVIVADDSSPIPFPRGSEGIRVVRREVNGGFGAAVNSGAAVATGSHLLILNSDLTLPPGFVDAMVERSSGWGEAVTGPAILAPSGAPDYTGRRFPRISHQVIEWLTPLARWRGRRWWHRGVGHDVQATPGHTVPVDWLVGAALLIPIERFREVGGFDERFFMNCEEIDLQRRLGQAGVPSVYLGHVSVTHEGGGSSDPLLRRRWLVGARLTYARKWGGHRRLIAALMAATGANFVWNLVRRAMGRETAPVATAREEVSLITST
ncbi:glycosyltransferase family 2 protein [Janibacter sp. GXQ6167]|uniref:glycosyltransferase family 2 protein n=1 Tax=Janibacter sp. GXQ6167 TaxID=3240791 RepID=UPI003525ECB9